MATQEVIKHSRKILHISKDGKKHWAEKLWEIVFEILIIVFAILLSLWLHNRSVEKHAQHTVHQFLDGVKQDLTNDLKEMEEDTTSITFRIKGVNYLQKAYFGGEVNSDSLNNYAGNIFFGSTLLIPNTGRFEGFKSSGQIAHIKDADLANQVVDYYQEDIPSLLWVSQSQNKFIEEHFQPYINKNLKQPHNLADSTAARQNIMSMLKDPEFFNLLLRYKLNAEVIVTRYRTAAEKSKKIIEKIEADK